MSEIINKRYDKVGTVHIDAETMKNEEYQHLSVKITRKCQHRPKA